MDKSRIIILLYQIHHSQLKSTINLILSLYPNYIYPFFTYVYS
jgi:hypothetical protein